MDPLSYTHLSKFRLRCSQLLRHLSQPEFHSVVDYFYWSPLDNTCRHRRVPKVFASIYETLIVKANIASVDKSSLNKGLAQLPSGLELFRILIIII